MAIYQLGDAIPVIAHSAYVAPNATLIGKVALAERASVWFGATLRGDNELISIGANSNVQEAAVMHTDMGFPLTVGENVTIGHQAVLHGCTIGAGTLIGIQAVVLDGAVIGKHCLVGAGALVTGHRQFADRSLILGAPAKVIRQLTDEEIAMILRGAEHYVRRGAEYKESLQLISERGAMSDETERALRATSPALRATSPSGEVKSALPRSGEVKSALPRFGGALPTSGAVLIPSPSGDLQER